MKDKNVTYLYEFKHGPTSYKPKVRNAYLVVVSMLVMVALIISCTTAPQLHTGRFVKPEKFGPTTQVLVTRTLTPKKEIEARQALDRAYAAHQKEIPIKFSMSPRLREFNEEFHALTEAKENEARLELERKMAELNARDEEEVLAQEQEIIKRANSKEDANLTLIGNIDPPEPPSKTGNLALYYIAVIMAVTAYVFRDKLVPIFRTLFLSVKRMSLLLWAKVRGQKNPFVVLALSYESFDPMI